MKKNIFKNNVSEIKKISEKMPKTINEAINFDEFDEEDEVPMEVNPEVEPEPAQDVEVEKPAEPAKNEASEKARKLIDDIRKMSLRAMAELAETPEDENYIMLKKVWSMTDRKPEMDKNKLEN